MIAEADKLRNEIEPEYHVYMKRVNDASKSLSDCRIERIKLEGKLEDIKHRIQEIYSRLGSYNENIGSILTIIDEKVPDK
jgi:predicted  nucleic acid-binding Zn-ribbon protein